MSTNNLITSNNVNTPLDSIKIPLDNMKISLDNIKTKISLAINFIISGVKSNIEGFHKFLASKNIIQVCIGLVVANNITKITNSIIDIIFTPLIKIITFGKIDNIKGLNFKILGVQIKLGELISVILDVFFMLVIIYFIWKFADVPKKEEKSEAKK